LKNNLVGPLLPLPFGLGDGGQSPTPPLVGCAEHRSPRRGPP